VIFIEEEAGQLFKDIAIAISCAVGLSLLVSITVIPSATHLLFRRKAYSRNGSLKDNRGRILDRIYVQRIGETLFRTYYRVMVNLIGRKGRRIQAKLGVVAGLLLLFYLSFALLPEAEYLPSGNRNLILVFAQPLVGMNIEKQVESIIPLEQQVQQFIDEGKVDRFFTVLGSRFRVVGIIMSEQWSSELKMQEMLNDLRTLTPSISGFESLFAVQASIFRDPGKQFDIEISGPDLSRIKTVSERIKMQLMGKKDMVTFVRSSYQEGAPEVHIRLDREKCARVGLRVVDVSEMVESLVAGLRVGSYYEEGNDIDLTIRAMGNFAQTKESLASLPLVTPTHHRVKLSNIAEVEVNTGPTSVRHLNKERSIRLTVNLIPDISLEKAIQRVENEVLAPAQATLTSSYSIRLGGAADKLNSTLEAFLGTFLLALLIIYLLMVALFESFTYPLIIMAAIPPAASGAFLGISLSHRLSGGIVGFDVLSMLGFVILAGVVVNNAVLIVHQALNFRKQGLDSDSALLESCSTRLRPICMSSFTSVLGMLPLAMGGGAGSELYRGLGAVVLGGLAVSTIFTLFLVPCLLSLVQDLQWYMAGKQWKMKPLERAETPSPTDSILP